MRTLLLISVFCFQLSAFSQGFFQPRIGGTNLVANWNFEEGNGTSARDSVGTNTGTLVNSPIWTNGIKGSALSFLQSSQNKVSITTTGPLQIGKAAFVISFWINPTAIANANNNGLISLGGSNNTGQGCLFLGNNGSLIYYANGYKINQTANLTTNKWCFISFAGNGGADGSRTVTLSTNGVTFATANFDYNFTASAWFIGQNQSSSAETFSGVIDDVRVYSRALNSSEITQLYNGGHGTQQ